MKTILQPPALDHDAMMLKRFKSKVSPNGKLERRIVFNLCEHLKSKGFELVAVFDGEEFTPIANDTKAAMELIFNLDEVSVRFQKKGFAEHGILLCLGEGMTIITDWSYTKDDPDGFDLAMDEFDSEDYV